MHKHPRFILFLSGFAALVVPSENATFTDDTSLWYKFSSSMYDKSTKLLYSSVNSKDRSTQEILVTWGVDSFHVCVSRSIGKRSLPCVFFVTSQLKPSKTDGETMLRSLEEYVLFTRWKKKRGLYSAGMNPRKR